MRANGRQRWLIFVAAVEEWLQKNLVWFWTIFRNYFLPLKILATGIRRLTRQNLLWPSTTWLNCTTNCPSTLAWPISSRFLGHPALPQIIAAQLEEVAESMEKLYHKLHSTNKAETTKCKCGRHYSEMKYKEKERRESDRDDFSIANVWTRNCCPIQTIQRILLPFCSDQNCWCSNIVEEACRARYHIHTSGWAAVWWRQHYLASFLACCSPSGPPVGWHWAPPSRRRQNSTCWIPEQVSTARRGVWFEEIPVRPSRSWCVYPRGGEMVRHHLRLSCEPDGRRSTHQALPSSAPRRPHRRACRCRRSSRSRSSPGTPSPRCCRRREQRHWERGRHTSSSTEES